MKLLVAIPAFNEEKTVSEVIKNIPRSISGIETLDILVINDGSNDNTKKLASAAGARVFDFPEHLGLAKAFQKAVDTALSEHYDILVNIDADMQFDPHDIPKLVAPVASGQADCVTASRFKDASLIPPMPVSKKWGNRKVASLISFITGHKLYDVSCGFRAYSREALLNLNLFSKFTYTHETILNLAFKGLTVLEMPIKVRGERQYGESKIARSLWKYGYNIFNTIFRTILDYKPLKFFGWAGASLFSIGIILDLFIFIRLLAIGEVSPYKTVGFLGLALNIFGLLLFIVGLLADSINRTRITQERVLYEVKKINLKSRN
ncbi:MAG: glycosyltransferase family 2 protein [Patescibacteria group bacterium]|jgi:glycosyltransferase involved in cell wall biosynthesis